MEDLTDVFYRLLKALPKVNSVELGVNEDTFKLVQTWYIDRMTDKITARKEMEAAGEERLSMSFFGVPVIISNSDFSTID